jgi:hypothetical protein
MNICTEHGFSFITEKAKSVVKNFFILSKFIEEHQRPVHWDAVHTHGTNIASSYLRAIVAGKDAPAHLLPMRRR